MKFGTFAYELAQMSKYKLTNLQQQSHIQFYAHQPQIDIFQQILLLL